MSDMHRFVGTTKALYTLHFILPNKMSLWFYNVHILVTTATILDIVCLLKRKTPKRFRSRVFLCIQMVRRNGAAAKHILAEGSGIRQAKLKFGNCTDSRHWNKILNKNRQFPTPHITTEVCECVPGHPDINNGNLKWHRPTVFRQTSVYLSFLTTQLYTSRSRLLIFVQFC